MRYSTAAALAMGHVAAAANFTTPAATTPAGPGSTPGLSPGANVPGFKYLGCRGSTDGFPSFNSKAISGANSPKECGKACAGSKYFGLYDDTCYCGSELSDASSRKFPDSSCSTPCPGDPTTSCGGLLSQARFVRRAGVPTGTLLSLFEAAGADIVTASPVIVTDTATITATHNGHATVETLVQTEAAAPININIICYGDFCASQNNFGACSECTKWRVVCQGEDDCHPQECHGAEEEKNWDNLVQCNGDDCKYACNGGTRKVECWGNECKVTQNPSEGPMKLVCHGDECAHQPCPSGTPGGKEVCTGNECKAAPPAPTTPQTPSTNSPPSEKVVYPSAPAAGNPASNPGGSPPTNMKVPSSPAGSPPAGSTPQAAGSAKMTAAAGLAAVFAGAAFFL